MSQFPNQKLTRKEIKKNHGSLEGWAEEVLTSIEGITSIASTTSYTNSYDKEVLLDLSNGVDEVDMDLIANSEDGIDMDDLDNFDPKAKYYLHTEGLLRLDENNDIDIYEDMKDNYTLKTLILQND